GEERRPQPIRRGGLGFDLLERFHVGHRLRLVDLVHRLADRARQRRRLRRGADDQAHERRWTLGHWHVHAGARLAFEPARPLVGDDAHDLPWDLWAERRPAWNNLLHQNALADWILLLEESPFHALVDDRDRWHALDVAIGERPPFDDLNPEHAEVLRLHH